jgi:hypothetical protein
MQAIQDMISTVASRSKLDAKAVSDCVEACFACAATCRTCADACLGESQVDKLRRCIGLNLDCADQCLATGNMALRTVDPDLAVLRAALQACAAACAACAAECGKHASMHDHCRVCAETCRRCETACRTLTQALVNQPKAPS